MKTVCLLLAAGSASRMKGSGADQDTFPKMLLPFHGKTLLQHIIDEVQVLKDTALLVVTGCYHDQLKTILATQQIPFVLNEQWEEGMGTSIQKGVIYLQQLYPDADNVIILVCDQPYISDSLLQQMIHTKKQSEKGIVACMYKDTTGTPVLFDKKYFHQLALLQGPYGAKKMVGQFTNDFTGIPFPEGAIDIDTPEDYEQLKKWQ
jgi:molybdenum cofactor cytidylyltransferase